MKPGMPAANLTSLSAAAPDESQQNSTDDREWLPGVGCLSPERIDRKRQRK